MFPIRCITGKNMDILVKMRKPSPPRFEEESTFLYSHVPDQETREIVFIAF